MSPFIIVSKFPEGTKIRLAVTRLAGYWADMKNGQHITQCVWDFDPLKPSHSLHVTETPEQIDALIAGASADFAQIEARVLAWAAGRTDGASADPAGASWGDPDVDQSQSPRGYIAVRSPGCSGCVFNANGDRRCPAAKCSSTDRKDGIDVIFKEKEKS